MALTQSEVQFMNWLKTYEPTVYALAAKRFAIKTGGKEVYGLSGYEGGISGLDDFMSTITDTIKNVLPAVVQYKSQNKILDAQLQRAKMGMPPLNVEDYSPVMRVQPSFDPQSEAALTRMAVSTTSSSIKQLLPFALAGLAAYMIMHRR